MLRRFRISGFFLALVAVLALSDLVQAESFGPAAPLLLLIQNLGAQLALWADPILSSVLGQLAPAGLPLSPVVLVGGIGALALDLLRGRARRERARGRSRA